MDLIFYGLLFLLAWTIINLLDKIGVLKKFGLEVDGVFFLAWKTNHGKKLIEKITNKFRKFLEKMGVLNVFISTLSIIVVTIFLGYQLFIMFTRPDLVSQATLGEAVLLPGLALPIFYGAIALGVAIIFHEFSHGIFARLNDIKITSIGAGIFAIIPLAFVEPDEEDIEKSSRSSKIQMFSAGPSINIYICLISVFLTFIMISAFFSPATTGVGITQVVPDSSASDIGLKPGLVIEEINNQDIENLEDFNKAMEKQDPGETINIKTDQGEFTATLGEKEGEAFLGIAPVEITSFYNSYKNPLAYLVPQLGTGLDMFKLDFFESQVNPNIVLPLIQTTFWVSLLNFWIGILNMMPIYPLDGGRVFRELIQGLMERISFIDNKEKFTKIVTTIISVVFLVIYLLPVAYLIIK
ncbi:MAG: Membrane-associated protease RseP regulator of RpoE activity in bacteria [Candidatus Methanohalarchaeum thermophilum]|uniref:Membrane-associated protease RseP regulator of RpoE activity in bacteria n=1 Tax=Methanohalarchaeum thermophilum TaxID=1903181 RepID=A0A1Q6DVC5_METT1|nr:MAG: Membrane-associated protease RseP regulator of RpoE activity in bacteria [Candidatus Methanohalarchaeum thermophilum]